MSSYMQPEERTRSRIAGSDPLPRRHRPGGFASLLAAGALALSAPAAFASAILMTSGQVKERFHWQMVTVGSVEEGSFEHNTEVRVFQERLDLPLTSVVAVDAIPGGGAGSIPIDTYVSSFLVHLDRRAPSGESVVTGWIEFDQDILGVLYEDGSLDATDASLGMSELIYPVGNFRGLEFTGSSGVDELLIASRRIDFTLRTNVHLDQIRILLKADGTGASFSVDHQGPTHLTAPAWGGGLITAGDILTIGSPASPGPNAPSFTPGTPGKMLDIGANLHIPIPGIGGVFELDALSFGRDAGDRLRFSVDEFARGVMDGDPAPDVYTEGSTGHLEASADLFRYRGPAIETPIGVTSGNRATHDGNATGPVVARGFGLVEPNPPSLLDPNDPGDNLDGLDIGTVPSDLGSWVFFSLDDNFTDPAESSGGSPNTGTGPSNGYSGAAVLMTAPGFGVYVYADIFDLGLIPRPEGNGDDIDALIVRDTELNPGDQVPSYDPAKDVIWFSLRRGSDYIGQPDTRLGLPITEADILEPGPAIVIPGEALGLWTRRQSLPGEIPDDVDGIDLFYAKLKPAADPDSAQTAIGQSVVIDVLANDVAGPGGLNPASVRIFDQPRFGTITALDPLHGQITYQHDGSGHSIDRFSYIVYDGQGEVSDVTTVSLDIFPASDVDPAATPASPIGLALDGSNPTASETRLRLRAPVTDLVSLTVYDISGKQVRRLLDEASGAEQERIVVWDGRDDRGKTVGSGVFYARLVAGSASTTLPLVRRR